MTSPIATFLQSQQTRLGAIQRSGADAFNQIWIAAGFDPARLLRNASWPVAILNDEGGARHDATVSIEDRRFSVTVVVCVQRDHMGENALLELLELIELALRGDGTNPGLEYGTGNAVVAVGDDEAVPVVAENGAMLVSKTVYFRYRLQR